VPRRAKIRPDEHGRARLIEAGRALFGEQGYDATSIAEIGARAGIAKSVLYHHFGSKAGLYRAVVEQDAQAIVEAVAAAVPPPGAPPPRLRPGVDAYLRFLSEHPDTWRLITRDPPRDPALRRVHETVAGAVGSSLRTLLAQREKARAKPHLVELTALAVRVYATWWREHPEVRRADVVEAIGDVAAASARRLR
jgi:AcrR family transcriptional regulator